MVNWPHPRLHWCQSGQSYPSCSLSDALCSVWHTNPSASQVPRPLRLANWVVGSTPLLSIHRSSWIGIRRFHTLDKTGVICRQLATLEQDGSVVFGVGKSPRRKKPPKHHIETLCQIISCSLRKNRKHTQWVSAIIVVRVQHETHNFGVSM